MASRTVPMPSSSTVPFSSSSPLIRTKSTANPREDYGREGCSQQDERGWLRRFFELIGKRQEADLVIPCAAGERDHLGHIDVRGMTREGNRRRLRGQLRKRDGGRLKDSGSHPPPCCRRSGW
jgi:hypothetical protein